MPSIKGQSILVIGGSSGIGFAVAKLALEQGADVTIASSNPTRINDAVDRLKTSFPSAQISCQTCDLSGADIEARLRTLFSTVTNSRASPLDHIVYTAIGGFTLKPLAEMGREDIVQAGHFHHVGPMLIAKLILENGVLREGPGASFVFTSGQIAEKPMKGWSNQVAVANGLYGMVRGLSLDLAPRRVNLVSPGATITEMWGPDKEGREKRAEMMKSAMLLGKVGTPEEVAEAYVYLMRDSNATGSVVSTNGGTSPQGL